MEHLFGCVKYSAGLMGEVETDAVKDPNQKCNVVLLIGDSASPPTGLRASSVATSVRWTRCRKIRKDGSPEIRRAVRTGKMRINRAYNLICAMEKGKDIRERNSSSTRKAARIIISDENFAILKELGGDPGDHVNRALEVYMRWLPHKETLHNLIALKRTGLRYARKCMYSSNGWHFPWVFLWVPPMIELHGPAGRVKVEKQAPLGDCVGAVRR